MASFRITQTAIFLSIFFIVQGLYEDQAGTYDWKQDYVGKVTHVHWDTSSHGGSGKKLFVATHLNTVASLNSHDGSIAWRQVAEEDSRGRIDTLLYNGNYMIGVQAGGKFVRSWHTPTGNLHWETFLAADQDMIAPAIFLNEDKDSVLVATAGTLTCLKTSDGKTEWEAALPDGDTVQRWYLSLRANGDIAAVGVSPGLRVTVVTVGPGGKVKAPRKLPAQWVQSDTSCQAVAGEGFVCYTPDTSALQFLSIQDGQVFKATPMSELGFSATRDTSLGAVSTQPGVSSPLVLLRVSRTHMALLSVSPTGVSVLRDLPKVEAADVAYEGEAKVLLTVQRADPETVEFTGVELTSMTEQTDVSQRISILAGHGSIDKIFPMLFTKKKDGKLGAKVMMVAQDYSLHCAHKAGKAPWRREEALAYILSVEMVDLPVSENEAKFEDEFGSSKDDILAMLVKRIKVQVSQLHGFVEHLVQRLVGHRHHHSIVSKNDAGDADIDDDSDDDELVRDAFSLHKMIVAVTAAGKVYGMRSHNGKITWQHFFPDLAPFTGQGQEKLLLFVQRTTAHFPHAPQCAVIGVSRKTGNGLVFAFNPVTGAMVTDLPPAGLDLGYKVLQAQLMNDHPDENFLKGVLLVDSDVKVHFFPASMKSVVEREGRNMFVHLTNPESGLMKGYWLTPRGQELVAENVWNIDLQGNQQKVTGVYVKRSNEHVHSQGRVLGDRSVLYKYLNPNLVVVIGEGEEASASTVSKGPSGFFNVYLVDAVTGHIVFHENHKRTRGPVSVVHSENWVVYSFYSEKHRRCEVAVLELYEGKEQSNATAFSSLTPPFSPLVLRQSYIFPVPIARMFPTITEKGITSKNLIMVLKVGGVLSLPKALLDPRRPSIPSQETMEEGTIPYIPELPVSTENFINYNLSMFNVRGIHTAPAGLESTSLVLVYGLDIFYTQVMPSKMFDVLKEDFDYFFIAGVLAIMILVSVMSQKLAARKALKRAWQ
ncbi:ER membrane protein complex subunit 1-like [Littorina saxatilis]|uniref:ER membrane protein complex subunit 1 n=1 Tax=Littorina saxatilis TaxID=31220 RepID=A0AAN9G2R0_9CAEN